MNNNQEDSFTTLQESGVCPLPSMSLRDYFAAAALGNIYTQDGNASRRFLARFAYELADAMLEVREE
jgi:hypothetical protein